MPVGEGEGEHQACMETLTARDIHLHCGLNNTGASFAHMTALHTIFVMQSLVVLNDEH